jgi:hypothetical protein
VKAFEISMMAKSAQSTACPVRLQYSKFIYIEGRGDRDERRDVRSSFVVGGGTYFGIF